MRHLFVYSLFSLSLTACFSDLSGTKIRTDGGGDADLAVDPSNDDGGIDPSADLKTAGDGGNNNADGAVAATCDLPYLAIVINGASVGRIERIPLDGRPPCKALKLGNSLPNDLNAIGFLPPSTIAVGGLNIVYQIKPDDKAAAGFWKSKESFAYGVMIDDVFPIQHLDGTYYLAATHDGQQFPCCGNSVEYVSVIDGDQDVTNWSVASSSGDIRIGSDVRGMAPSARDAHKIFAAKGLTDPYFAAGEFQPPWDGSPVEVTMPYYQAGLGGPGDTRSVKTLRVSSGSAVLARTAWVFKPQAGGAYQVYFVNDDLAGTKDLVGPLTCDLPQCATEATAPIYDVVPDPTNNDAVLAICSDKDAGSSWNKSHVVRMKGDGTCQLVFDGEPLLSNEYPVRLANAILQP